MKFFKIFLLCFFLSNAAVAQDKIEHPPLIITSINPLYQILLAITQDKSNSVLIMNPNLSEHNYQLKKSDVEAFSKADLIFYIDDELEKNFPKLIKNFAAEKKSYEISEIHEVNLLQRRDNSKKLDIHLWMNPKNAVLIAKLMAQKICEIDQKNCEIYQKNYRRFAREVAKEEQKIFWQLSQIKDADYIFYHDGYQYFEHHFGLQPLAIIARDDRELSVKEARDLDLLMKSKKVKCIFGDMHDEKNSAQNLAQNYGVKFIALNLVGEKNDSYVSLLDKVGSAVMQCGDKILVKKKAIVREEVAIDELPQIEDASEVKSEAPEIVIP